MATHVGKEGSVANGANTVAEVNGWELTESAELVEDSELSDEWRTFKSGTDVYKEWSATVTCWWDETDTNGQIAMSLGASVTLNLYGEGKVAGDTYYTGTAIVEERGTAVAKGAIIERTMTLRGSGALSETTV
jgi:hypothetical protein